MNRLPIRHVHDHQPVRQPHYRFNGIRHPLFNSFLHHQPIHNDLNIMLNILFQLDGLRQLMQVPIDADTNIAAALGLLQNLFMAAFPAAHNGRQKLDLRPLRQFHDLVHHLIHRLLTDLPPALGAMGDPHPRVQKTHIIINFRDRSHRGARIAIGGFLVDGNCRGQSLDALHIRLFHLSQELAGIGRQRLHIPPLPLRVNRIKGQRGLSRSGKSRQHHQLIPGYIQGNIF